MDNLQFEMIRPDSGDGAKVLKIQEQYKKFFFVPFEQLSRAIDDGHILGAFQESDVIAYVWSFTRNAKVTIRYLAVDKAFEKRGVGRRLAEEVIRRNQHAYGVRLRQPLEISLPMN